MSTSGTKKIAILGASGKLGSSTLRALLTHNLHPATHIIALTSSLPNSQTWTSLTSIHPSLQIRHADFNDPSTIRTALHGVDVLFLISTPKISLDFNNAAPGHGREKPHIDAINAAVEAGVGWIVYSSLAFAYPSFHSHKDIQSNVVGGSGGGGGGSEDDDVVVVGHSKAGVMRAHLRTETHLASLARQGTIKTTIIREGLYNESWPLYLGYFDIPGYLHTEKNGDITKKEKMVKLAGDGKICWTSIKDLGIGSAWILSRIAADRDNEGSGEEWLNRKLYLSTSPEQALTMKEIAGLVAEGSQGKVPVEVEIVSQKDHVDTYVEKQGAESRPAVEWWVSTYLALEDGECLVDDPALGHILSRVGVRETTMQETITEMLKSAAR